MNVYLFRVFGQSNKLQSAMNLFFSEPNKEKGELL